MVTVTFAKWTFDGPPMKFIFYIYTLLDSLGIYAGSCSEASGMYILRTKL